MPRYSPLTPIFDPPIRRGSIILGNSPGSIGATASPGVVTRSVSVLAPTVTATSPIQFAYLWDYSDNGNVTISGGRFTSITDQIAGVVLTERGIGPNAVGSINGVQTYRCGAGGANDWRNWFRGTLPTPMTTPYVAVWVVQWDRGDSFTTFAKAPTVFEAETSLSGGTYANQISTSLVTDDDWVYGYGGNLPATNVGTHSTPYAMLAVHRAAPATSELWISGVQVATSTSLDGRSPQGRFTLANANDPTGGNAQSWTGDVALMGFSSGAPSAGQITGWFADMTARYGT